MTQSIRELRTESERSRADLAATVNLLREQVTATAEDIRSRVSPQHIKSEVQGYISQKAWSWLDTLKQQARDNPMGTVAAGSAVAIPFLGLVRRFPLPLLMMGAGLALTSKTLRGHAADAAAPTMDTARELLDASARRAGVLQEGLKDTVASGRDRMTGVAQDAQGAASGFADGMRSRAAAAAGAVTDKLGIGMDTANDALERATSTAKDAAAAGRSAVQTAPAKARQVISDNATVIAGLGIAIGAIIATALPATKVEAKVMGPVSDSTKRAADEVVQSGLQAVSDITLSSADAAAKSIADADLGGHASRLTQNIAGTVKDAAAEVLTAAFDPPRNTNL
jgi:hypothetical protein